MKCPKCGKEITDDSLYCEYCGEKIKRISFIEKKPTKYKLLWITLIIICVSFGGILYYEHEQAVSAQKEVLIVQQKAEEEARLRLEEQKKAQLELEKRKAAEEALAKEASRQAEVRAEEASSARRKANEAKEAAETAKNAVKIYDAAMKAKEAAETAKIAAEKAKNAVEKAKNYDAAMKAKEAAETAKIAAKKAKTDAVDVKSKVADIKLSLTTANEDVEAAIEAAGSAITEAEDAIAIANRTIAKAEEKAKEIEVANAKAEAEARAQKQRQAEEKRQAELLKKREEERYQKNLPYIRQGYVDLGLPSGTLWKSSDESGFFNYQKANSQYGYKMPTKSQWEELINNCSWSYINKDTGFKVIGRNSNYIYIPLNGCQEYFFMDFGNGTASGYSVINSSDGEGYYFSSSSSGNNTFWRTYISQGKRIVEEKEIKKDMEYSVRLVIRP